jgi:hypothetical protein
MIHYFFKIKNTQSRKKKIFLIINSHKDITQKSIYFKKNKKI